MKKVIVSIILILTMLINMMPVMAFNLPEKISEFITEDNVINNIMQSSLNTSKSPVTRAISSGFDVVFGFDMSVDMLKFDYNYEKEWVDLFLSIQEQAPEGTSFSSVISNAEESINGMDNIAGTLASAKYSGESDITELLDRCMDEFDNDDSSKIIIATAANVDNISSLISKINEVMNYGIIPFIFILDDDFNGILDNNLDMVYYCPESLSLRLAMSDLYLSFAEFGQEYKEQTRGIGAKSLNRDGEPEATPTETPGDSDENKNDFRQRNWFTINNNLTIGSALISVLNIYSVLPLKATGPNSSNNLITYDLMNVQLSSGNNIGIDNLISFLKGNTGILNTAVIGDENILNFEEIWEKVYHTRKSSANKIEIISNNLKKRFPIAAIDNNNNPYIIIGLDTSNSVTIYNPNNPNGTVINLNNISSVFDTYSYLNHIALNSYHIKSRVEKDGTEVTITKTYSSNYNAANVRYIGTNSATRTNNYNNFVLEVDLANVGSEQFVIAAPVEFNNGYPDMYDPTQFYTLRLYNDVETSSEWYYDYLIKATNLGIVNGDDHGNFNPDNPVLRCEFIKMLIEAAQIPTQTPAPEQHWASEYMNKASALGILYDPNSNWDSAITRGEVAYTLKKLFMDKIDDI